jgi:hypothetical protein
MFRGEAELLVGRRGISADELLRLAYRRFPDNPQLKKRVLSAGEPLRVADIAKTTQRSAVYIGRGRWVQSGSRWEPVKVVSTIELKRAHATFIRSALMLDLVPVEGEGMHYWVLCHGSGQQANAVRKFCELRQIPVSTKRTSYGNKRWVDETVQGLE